MAKRTTTMKQTDANRQYDLLLQTALQLSADPEKLTRMIKAHCPTVADLTRLGLEEENELVVESHGQLAPLLAAVHLGQQSLTSQPIYYGTAYSSRGLGEAMVNRLADRDCEEVVIACTNVHNDIIDLVTMFRGGQAECNVYPEEILRYALKAGAHGIVMIHNHPTGDPAPSSCDQRIMDRLQSACTIVGIQLLDCLITGNGQYYSLREEEASHHVS